MLEELIFTGFSPLLLGTLFGGGVVSVQGKWGCGGGELGGGLGLGFEEGGWGDRRGRGEEGGWR